MSVGGVGPVSFRPAGIEPVAGGPKPTERTGAGFADAIGGALESVSAAEHEADRVVQEIATGGDAGVYELMAASTKAQLGVEMLVQVRNKAIEAYQQIMNMQV